MASPALIRVLLLEANAADAAQLRGMIESGSACHFQVVGEESELVRGIEFMCNEELDVALVDLTLADCQGLESFTRAHEIAPHVPVIVLSGIDDEEFAAQAVHLGAQDYLVKGQIDAHLLQRALRYAVERSRSEAQLARERDLLHTLLDNIPDRIYFKDRESRFIRINRPLQKLFHLERPEEVQGKTDADFYGACHAAAARADEEQVMETGKPIFNKVEFETLQDGTKSWSLTTKLPLRDRHGKIEGTCGISREITEMKEMEEQFATERNLLRSVIDNLPDAIFLKDTEGRYLLDNVAHWRGLGATSPAQVIGRTVSDFFPEEVAEYFHQNDMSVLSTGEAMINHEERVFDVRGHPRWQLSTKVPWRNEDGSMLGVLCIARDITGQKEAAEKLRLAYAEVAHSREELLVAMSKLQTAHQELRDVQLQLIEAEKMKSIGRLAAGVAHEVKNPLAIIKMGLEFLKQGITAESIEAPVVKEMTDAVNRADGVIRGLLDFSAPQQAEKTQEDLNAIIDQALSLVRGEVKPGVEIIRELQSRLPKLPMDAVKMSQVFVNLVTNGLHAIGAGPGTLTVRTYSKQLTGVGANISSTRSESLRVGGTIVVAEIDDTGHGIPEDKLGKIFEPFYTTKATGVGTGLGLSVVKTIIDLHAATIDVRNLHDAGARVTIMFQV